MKRRQFLVSTVGVLSAAAVGDNAAIQPAVAASTTSTSGCSFSGIPAVEFYSPASQLDANYDELTDEDIVVVWAEPNATSDSGLYEDVPAPMISEDGRVVGIGAPLVEDHGNVQFDYGQEELLMNLWDAKIDGSTVLWDESHDQYHTLDKFTEFHGYAADNDYTLQATMDFSGDLSGADAVVIPSPSNSFSNAELDDLVSFVADGGAVFLHDQSNFNGHDETANLNEIAEHLSLAFRFNGDEINDESNNYDGKAYAPTTENFNHAKPYFTDRAGLGFEYPKEYTATVVSVTDGDTFDVQFEDGSEETIRHLGIDTPETGSARQGEDPEDWVGIDDDQILADWGEAATDFAQENLDGETITVFFDEEEFVRGNYGRLLAYMRYDKNGDGSRDKDYNLEMIEEGYARVYNSGFARHTEFNAAWWNARENDVGIWAESDPDATGEIRNDPVDELLFPEASSVRTTAGAIDDSRVPVFAESTAEQELGDGVAYDDIPLIGVDEEARIALVGGILHDDTYKSDDQLGNYEFLANLLDYLSDKPDDMVMIAGGQQQFSLDYNASKEGTAMFQRFLEGLDAMEYEAVNDFTEERLAAGHALIIPTPKRCIDADEVDAISSFIADGGSVLLLGSDRHDDRYRANLDQLAADLGTDLRLNGDLVIDSSNNLGSEDEPLTSQFNEAYPLFDPYAHDGGNGDDGDDDDGDGDDGDDGDDCWPPGHC